MVNKGKSGEVSLVDLKRKSILMGLCEKYREKWDACASKKQLVDMALDSNGIEFMADAIAFGWGLSKEYLMQEFGEFMNGFYRRQEEGYASEMYIGAHEVLSAESTLLLIGYCDDIEIEIPEHAVCRIYICGGSSVRIENNGKVELLVYGAGNNIVVKNYGGTVLRKDVTKSKWVGHESDNA